MSYTTPIEFEITSPVLLDAKIAEIQAALKTSKLSWNEYSFERAYRHAKLVDGAKVYYPAIYQGKVPGDFITDNYYDYLTIFPNDNLDSYSFVYVKQPQTLGSETSGFHDYSAELSIIIVFRMNKIGATNDYRFIELLKYDVIRALEDIPDLNITDVYDEIENCFSDFTVSEIEYEYLSEKYGGLRFDCSVEYSNNCQITNTY